MTRTPGIFARCSRRRREAGFVANHRCDGSRAEGKQFNNSALLRARDEARGETTLKGVRMRGGALDRVRQRGRKQRRLACVELARSFVEIVLRSNFNAEEPVAPFSNVALSRCRPRNAIGPRELSGGRNGRAPRVHRRSVEGAMRLGRREMALGHCHVREFYLSTARRA
jgi:hypothetical protein